MNEDNCCYVCKSPHGVCLTNHTCDHHVAARLREESWRLPYPDPVGERAAGRVDAERRRQAGRRRT